MIPRWEDGVADWVVLHGGAMAVLRVPSLAEAAQLAQAMAQIAGLDGALMMLTDGQLTVRLTRDMWQLEERHIELAHAVSAVAREHGAVADRTLAQEVQFAVAAQPDAIDVGFWRAVLGYARPPGLAEEMGDDNGVDPLGHGSTVSSTTPVPPRPGSSPTAVATGSASRPGPMVPPARPGADRRRVVGYLRPRDSTEA